MTALWIDAQTGLAGDMLLAGLLDLGVPEDVIHQPLVALGLAGLYRLEVSESRSGGLRGRRVDVLQLEEQPPHRHWADIRQQLQTSALPNNLRQRVLAVFEALAVAEAAVHGASVDAVHFHEVGAIDALVDVVGVCACLEHLNPQHICCSPLPTGSGTVNTAHGRLPVPVPAVIELARRYAVPLVQAADQPEAELVTPTGLALIAVFADQFGSAGSLTPKAVGIGLGHRRLDRPNLLRLILADAAGMSDQAAAAAHWQPIVVQEAWLDDATPEDLALLIDRLRQAGAVDVAAQPLLMKKGRCGQAITALVAPEQADALRTVWFSSSSSIGLRERQQGRWLLPRRAGTLETPWGVLPAKQVRRPDGTFSVKPESDGLAELSQSSGCSIAMLRAAALQAAFVSDEEWSW